MLLQHQIEWKNPHAEGFKSLQILTTEEKIGNVIASLRTNATGSHFPSRMETLRRTIQQLDELWQQYQRELSGETPSIVEIDDCPF